MKKQSIDLQGVSKTLLLPLAARAKYSKKYFSPLHDALAVELVESIDYPFDSLLQGFGDVALILMARAYQFDEAIKKYIQKNPKGTIVNLGAGLDTTFFRVRNPDITWIDLDLPNVIALRNQLLPQSKQVHALAKSVLDYSWMEDLKPFNDSFLFFAGGLVMYFPEQEIKGLFTTMAEQFPGSELVFDTISKRSLYYANKTLKASKMENAVMHWGVDDISVVGEWSSYLQFVDTFALFRGIRMKKGFPCRLRLKMFLYDLGDKSSMAHVRFRDK